MKESHELYWIRRQIANEAKAVNYAEARLRDIRRQYRVAKASIDREIADFYKKYAGPDGKVNPAAAAIPIRSKLTRIGDLKRRIQKQLAALATKETEWAKLTLSTVYEDTYYKTHYELQRFRGLLRNVERLSSAHVDRAISTAWSGRSYSARIWGRHQHLGRAVAEIITQGVLMGHSSDRMARQLAARMDASYSAAKRLVRTESNYVYNQAGKQSYEAAGVEEYEFLATLDMRTSETCQQHDRKRYLLRDAQVGRNFPPMHPNCRSTTIPYFAEDAGERIARDAADATVHVQGQMTYSEWRKRYIAA